MIRVTSVSDSKHLLRIRSIATFDECFNFEALHRKRDITMKAIRFHEYGGPDVLRYEDVELPVPSSGRSGSASRAHRSTGWTATSARG